MQVNQLTTVEQGRCPGAPEPNPAQAEPLIAHSRSKGPPPDALEGAGGSPVPAPAAPTGPSTHIDAPFMALVFLVTGVMALALVLLVGVSTVSGHELDH